MSLVDEIDLEAFSGKGGDGVVRWLALKGGPAGGDGGKGGDVVIRGVRDILLLGKYRGNTTFRAGDGKPGGKQSLHGSNGKDVVVDLPVGSVVRVGEKEYELLEEGDEQVVLKGGAGGFGNEHFKSSRNVRPMQSTEGKPGMHATLKVELRLIADIGLVGFPNAGKTSLLNALTNARAKVGNYEFTTLDPNLGDYFGYIIADIPGIIEGASEGRGLGHKFLRHISRTKALIFCISVEQDDHFSVYRALLDELSQFDPNLLEIPSMIVLTKTDLASEGEVASSLGALEASGKQVLPVSVHEEASVKSLGDSIVAFVRAS
ncbi:GTPase ObgE [bacterium]|nr:GTPase ObgE [bacterium]|tara:strand:+ start:15621 stop:16574 length:954 start_codon:yes stop_codon:yes gene_type:complete